MPTFRNEREIEQGLTGVRDGDQWNRRIADLVMLGQHERALWCWNSLVF